MSENDDKALQRALNHYPEIQKHLLEQAAKESGQDDPYAPYWTTREDGRRTLHFSPDSWWLSRFDRRDVLLDLPGIAVMNTQDWHADAAAATIREAYKIPYDEPCDDCFDAEAILAQIERFPQGQFVAIRTSGPGAGHAVGMAATMRTSRPPTAPILPWIDAIGDTRLSAHEPEGDWLYGVEMAVRPDYRRIGIGTGLYRARFALVKALNLRGWYAVGMLMGYRKPAFYAATMEQKAKLLNAREADKNGELDEDERYAIRELISKLPTHADLMDVREYGERVIQRQIKDPTVTMQMNRGFRAVSVVTDYDDEPQAGNAGALIVWQNPDYRADD